LSESFKGAEQNYDVMTHSSFSMVPDLTTPPTHSYYTGT
jgi:hypothetical protein